MMLEVPVGVDQRFKFLGRSRQDGDGTILFSLWAYTDLGTGITFGGGGELV